MERVRERFLIYKLQTIKKTSERSEQGSQYIFHFSQYVFEFIYR